MSILKFLVIILFIIGCGPPKFDADLSQYGYTQISGEILDLSYFDNPIISVFYTKGDTTKEIDIKAKLEEEWNTLVPTGSTFRAFLCNDTNDNFKCELEEKKVSINQQDILADGTKITLPSPKLLYIEGELFSPSFTQNPMAYIEQNGVILQYSKVERNRYSFIVSEGENYKIAYFENIDENGIFNPDTDDIIGFYPEYPITLTQDTSLNSFTLAGIDGIISSIPSSSLTHPIVALAYINASCWLEIEKISMIDSNGYYKFIVPQKKYRILIINDANQNGDFDHKEDYVTVPPRGSVDLCSDSVIDLESTIEHRIDITLGTISGNMDTSSTTYTYPQISLQQGWDIMQYNPIDSTTFDFFAVKSYTVDGNPGATSEYYLLAFDDDNTHDGVYTYSDENDEVNTYGPYSADAVGLSPIIP